MKEETKTTKVADVKEAAKTSAKPAAKKAETPAKPAAPAAKKTAAKPAAKKAAAKPAAKKPAAKKTTKKAAKKEANVTTMVLQFAGNDVVVGSVEEKIKAQFVAEGHRVGNIKKLDIYVKPEDNAAYYVINDGKYDGKVDLF